MKKIWITLLVLVLVCPPVIVAHNDSHNSKAIVNIVKHPESKGIGQVKRDMQKSLSAGGSNKGGEAESSEKADRRGIERVAIQGGRKIENETDRDRRGSSQKTGRDKQNTGVKESKRMRARNLSELKQIIQKKRRRMNKTLHALMKNNQGIYQNRLRLAVYSLLTMENFTGGIGRNVSRIAREFNNSIQATIRAEERIKKRNGLVRFFIGGDEEAAEELEQEVNHNRNRIQRLKHLMKECNCDDNVRAIMRGQVKEIERGQSRLTELAQNEKRDKGLFGWIFGFWR